MGITSWFIRKSRSQTPSISANKEDQRREAAPTEKEIFKSPALLAGWVSRVVLAAIPLEKDYQLPPDEQTRKDLNITPAQRERCVREYSLLRVAGVSLFIKQQYPDHFWLAFSKNVAPHVCRHMYGSTDEARISEIARTIGDRPHFHSSLRCRLRQRDT